MTKTPMCLLAALAGLLLSGAPQYAAATESPEAAPAPAAPAAQAHAKAKALAEKITKKIVITATASAKDDKDADQDDATDGEDSADSATAHEDKAVVSIGHDSTLAAGEHADAVVSVFGSSTSAGEVNDAVVSVFGNTRVTGPVGDAAVAVLGSTSVDSHVKGEVVAVLGDVELGPHAEVDGNVVVVGGTLKRDPAAIVHGGVQNIVLFGAGGHLEWLHIWVQHCLVYGRPLALAPGLGWAWAIAFSFLALYLLIALLFPKGIEQCVRTMDEQPGRSVLASILTVLAKPIVFVLLVATVIGIALVPFLAMALFIAGLFGKAVALAWLGRRVLSLSSGGANRPPVLAVLVGGLIALLLYLVPVLGFVAYKGLDILGLGIVVYTLIRNSRGAREVAAAQRAAPAEAAGGGGAAAVETPPGATPAAAAPAAAAPAAPAAAPPAVPAADASMERAGFWIRLAALTLDLIIVAIVCALLPFWHVDGHSHGFLLLMAAYGALMWKLKGSTIGGIICHLRVVRLDGRAIDWPTAVARALGCFLSLAVAGLGFLWVVFDPERQSWHDKIAGTVVVRLPRGTPLV
jgi:uncharacterized RDD family membrane protein YckC